MRCFIAIRFPDEVNRELGRQIHYLAGTDAAVRWVKAENLHVTLKFLGDVQDDEVQDVHRALSQVSCPPMSLSICGLGCFPPKGRPRVVWAGLEGDVDRLVALAGHIEQQVAPLGYPPEQRGFRAHVTIGRVKGKRHMDALMLAIERRTQQLRTPSVEIDTFVLYQSELGGGGPRYCKISTYPLTAAEA